MSLLARTSLVVTVLLLLAPAAHAQAGEVSWSKDLTTAFAEAKSQDRILMICVNARYVDGKKTEERAAKGLREVVYKDARIVAKSREFVCVLFTPGSDKSEFGELRLLGIEGDIVSPQHIFVHPEGKTLLLRKQYWSHGKGEAAVTALLAMMDQAQKRLADGNAQPDNADEPVDAPSGDERASWIRDRIQEVVNGSDEERKRAIDQLVKADKSGDCTMPLMLLLPEHKKNKPLVVDLIRALGRDQLFDASLLIQDFLSHRDEKVRGNAAVSLEYIGNPEKMIVAALLKAVGREKDPAIANHMYRALGRCGVQEKKVRSLLLKKCGSAKSEFASYGPAIGLAYFAGDKKAARGVEKILKKIGIPGGRRGGGGNTVKRGVVCWTLGSIGDPKSGKFVREELIDRLKNVQAFWVKGLTSFYKSVAKTCEGDTSAMASLTQGVRGFVDYAKRFELDRFGAETRGLMDEYRKNRKESGFTPKGDYLLGADGDM